MSVLLDYSFCKAGDAALYVLLGEEEINDATNARVHALVRALDEKNIFGITDIVPGYWNLLIEFNANQTTHNILENIVNQIMAAGLKTSTSSAKRVLLPVEFNGEDLAGVSTMVGCTTREFISRFTAREYSIFTVGFTPGFPYLGTLEERLQVPRLTSPRKVVPANSVAIAGGQVGIYPVPSPGGWNLIGTTREAMYDPQRKNPFLLSPGDRVRFTAVSAGSFAGQTKKEKAEPPLPIGGTPVLRVLQHGLQDTLQDAGRFAVGRFGLANAGALDARALYQANAILGNDVAAPVLECTLRGPHLQVLHDSILCVVGATAILKKFVGTEAETSEAIKSNTSFFASKGCQLLFEDFVGARAYLGVAGGFVTSEHWGSASTDIRAQLLAPLRQNDELLSQNNAVRVRQGFDFEPFLAVMRGPLRVHAGPQAHLFSEESWNIFTNNSYRVASADRTGLRLEGQEIPALRHDIVSEGVPLGAIQVSPDGLPMLLLNDRGRLGGYAKIAVLAQKDLPRVAQLREGERIRFKIIS